MAAAGSAGAQVELRAIAMEVAGMLAPGQGVVREWARLGVEVQLCSMATSGLCVRGTRRVFVSKDEPHRRQRYTAAHEVAHLLLAQATPNPELAMSWQQEERLCDAFASLVLIPRQQLARYLETSPPTPTLDWLEAASENFCVSWTALVVALSGLRWSGDAAYLLVHEAGHPRRPHERALRVYAAGVPGHILLPRHKRLTSLGWKALAEWASGQEPGARRSERDGPLALPVGPHAPSGTARWKGDVGCEAMVVAGKYRLIVAADLAALHRERSMGRRSIRRTQPLSGQLSLTMAG